MPSSEDVLQQLMRDPAVVSALQAIVPKSQIEPLLRNLFRVEGMGATPFKVYKCTQNVPTTFLGVTGMDETKYPVGSEVSYDDFRKLFIKKLGDIFPKRITDEVFRLRDLSHYHDVLLMVWNVGPQKFMEFPKFRAALLAGRRHGVGTGHRGRHSRASAGFLRAWVDVR